MFFVSKHWWPHLFFYPNTLLFNTILFPMAPSKRKLSTHTLTSRTRQARRSEGALLRMPSRSMAHACSETWTIFQFGNQKAKQQRNHKPITGILWYFHMMLYTCVLYGNLLMVSECYLNVKMIEIRKPWPTLTDEERLPLTKAAGPWKDWRWVHRCWRGLGLGMWAQGYDGNAVLHQRYPKTDEIWMG